MSAAGPPVLSSPEAAAHWLRGHAPQALRSDSRKLQEGDALLAWPGATSDARAHVRAALATGASACLVEAQGVEAFGFDDARIACYDGLKRAAGPVSAAFYGMPSSRLDVLAVTGTNGKTSTAWWLAHALSHPALQRRGGCGVIGTLGIGQPPALVASGLTSPDPVLLQASLAEFVAQGLSACAIEASSVGIVERRLDGLQVRVAVFTNFTQDHLDYHGSMDAYWAAKSELFDWPGLRAAVVNLDDPKGRELATRLNGRGLDLWTYGCAPDARVRATDISHAGPGLAMRVSEAGESKLLQTRVAGQFNVSNLLAVIATLRALAVPLAAGLSACAELQPVPGRMEWVLAPGQPLVAVDYAHTPDALDKVLAGLRPVAAQRGGQLWCLFGCGGNRDPLKRPRMGAIAAELADRVVLTSDNPRDEPPQDIIDQVLAGIGAEARARVQVQANRALAIAEAVKRAAAADVVLLAGKGHEDYQEVRGERLPFSDREQAALALRQRACSVASAADGVAA